MLPFEAKPVYDDREVCTIPAQPDANIASKQIKMD
jgi:hypothetical protein